MLAVPAKEVNLGFILYLTPFIPLSLKGEGESFLKEGRSPQNDYRVGGWEERDKLKTRRGWGYIATKHDHRVIGLTSNPLKLTPCRADR